MLKAPKARCIAECSPRLLKPKIVAPATNPSASTMNTTDIDSDRLFYEFGDERGQFVARVSLGQSAPQARQPSLPFQLRRLAMDIGDHAIVSLWNNGMESQVVDMLVNEQEIQMSYLTVVRVGFRGLDPRGCPITIIVAIQPSSLGPDDAKGLLDKLSHYIYQSVLLPALGSKVLGFGQTGLLTVQ